MEVDDLLIQGLGLKMRLAMVVQAYKQSHFGKIIASSVRLLFLGSDCVDADSIVDCSGLLQL